jgi:hypothetical protein
MTQIPEDHSKRNLLLQILAGLSSAGAGALANPRNRAAGAGATGLSFLTGLLGGVQQNRMRKENLSEKIAEEQRRKMAEIQESARNVGAQPVSPLTRPGAANTPVAGLQAIQDITAPPITPQMPFGGGEDQFGSPEDIEQAPDPEVTEPMKVSIFDASEEELNNAIAQRNRKVADQDLKLRSFAADPTAEGSLAFMRTPGGAGAVAGAKADAVLPSQLARGAGKSGVNPFNFDGTRKPDVELVAELSLIHI